MLNTKFKISVVWINAVAGLYSTDGSRNAARYRDKFASSAQTFLSHRLALPDGFSQHAGQRMSIQTIGSFCRPGAHHFLKTARVLYANEPMNSELNALMGATVYAIDSTTMDLYLNLFNWAPFPTAKVAVKLHTLVDLKGSIPCFIYIAIAKCATSKYSTCFAGKATVRLAGVLSKLRDPEPLTCVTFIDAEAGKTF